MEELRFAAFGAGFWARYQLAAWQEVPGARCVAIYNRTRARAEELAQELGSPTVYDDPELLLERERPDFVDIITHPNTHAGLVELAVAHRIPVVCQKPLTPTLGESERLVSVCRRAGVRLIVHENIRWQTPIRALKGVLDSGVIGRPFRARIQFCTSFPVFENQPYLKELDQFILADLGVHLLDVARFLFGEADRVYCQTAQVHLDIRGEDVATIILGMGGTTCIVELSFASRLADERFPQIYAVVEAEQGSLDLGPDYTLRVTTAQGTSVQRHPPPRYAWADQAYEVAQSSMVACNGHILKALRTGQPAETEAEDNIRTLRLVDAAYASAASGQAVAL